MRARLLLLCLATACQAAPQTATSDGRAPDTVPSRGFEPPVATNAASPVHYPARLYDQTTEGTVILRLHVDAAGTVAAESTRVAESSGYPALDSAALSGVRNMTFAPARRNGVPVAATFLQPVYFRHPDRRGAGGRP